MLQYFSMNTDDITHLATLSRLELTEKEMQKFPGQLESILGFIDQIKDVEISGNIIRDMQNYNTFREDTDHHEAGESREEIIAGMPNVQDDYLKTKKILNN